MEEKAVKKRRPKTEVEKQHLRELAAAKWKDPEYIVKFNAGYQPVKSSLPEKVRAASNKISEGVKASWTEERKEAASKAFKESWTNTPERKVTLAKRMKETWANPILAKNRADAIAAAKKTVDSKLKASTHATTMWSGATHRQHISESMKATWQDPEYRSKVLKNTAPVMRSDTVKLIVEELEAEKGSVGGLCNKYNFSHTTMGRILRANNLEHHLGANVSTPQEEVAIYIESLGFKVIRNDRKALAPMELDVYVPDRGFAVEFNGLYWHSAAAPSYKTKQHYLKAERASAAGIDLLAIFEDEWEEKRTLIKAMISHRLGCSNAQRLYAKNLSVVELSAKECKVFHDEYHLDGGLLYRGYGLKDGDVLVAAMSLRSYKSAPYNSYTEVARFAVHSGYSVTGAMGKLLSLVGGGIISYSNNRLSRGNVYKVLGFVEDTVAVAPSYWYTDFQTRVFRTRCRRVNSPEILSKYPTEETQAANGIFSRKIFKDSRPLYRVEDYGHRRWVLRKKNVI